MSGEYRGGDGKEKILIVLHQETSSPGRVGRHLVSAGYELDIRKPRFGDPLPDTMAEHRGAIIFGGPMSANDTDDFVKAEIDWTEVCVREEAPFLGICLGAQMLAKKLGAGVYGCPNESAEIGYYDIMPTETAKRMMDWPEKVYQWHREGFELPEGAELLAGGPDPWVNQAFRYGRNAYAVQFHAELSYQMMNKWLVKAAHRLVLPNAQPRRAHFDGRALYDGAVRKWLAEFLDHWVADDPRSAADEKTSRGKAA